MARPRHISDILYTGIGGERFQEHLAQVRVLREWEGVVGPRVARVTRALAVRNGVLCVAVRGAVWKAELEYLKDDIIAAVNERLGRAAVQGIRLTSGYRDEKRPEAQTTHEGSPSESKPARVGARERRRIERSVSIIGDPRLRGALQAAWESKKGLDETRRQAGWKRCRACGEYGAWTSGICRACVLDMMATAPPGGANGAPTGGMLDEQQGTGS
jgi:predicted nucleic acid-binding Zn ribbon protein